MEKPKQVAIGQRWHTAHNPKEVYEVFARTDDGRWRIRYEGGGESRHTWQDGGILCDTYLGPTESGKSEGRPVDWERWLPPRELPATGKKEFKAGQIWACNNGVSGNACVVRILDGHSRWGQHLCEYLAGAGHWGKGKEFPFKDDIGAGSSFADQAILVADVGCEPIPPEVLYGPPQAPVAGEPAKPWTCSHDSSVTVGAMDRESFDYLRSREFAGHEMCNGLRVPFPTGDKQ